jgi:hypothetical protein
VEEGDDLIHAEIDAEMESVDAELAEVEEAARVSDAAATKKFIKSTKKMRGESAEEFAARIEVLVCDGRAARSARAKAREKPKQPDSFGPDDPNPFSDDDSMDDVPFSTRARCAFPSLAF